MSTQFAPVTLQQILRHAPSVNSNGYVKGIMDRIARCRQPVNGYHLYQCSNKECGYLKYCYHSCHNRHCPSCGALGKEAWIEARQRELLPVKYYHVVFTIPHLLNSLVMGNRKLLYKLLFDASAQTLLSFAADERYLGATPGIISVLHTWGQQLSFHPHVHCIVSGGGITNRKDKPAWVDGRKNDWRFLFPVEAMGTVFRGKYLEGIKKLLALHQLAIPEGICMKQLLNQLYQKDWLTYAKAPFGGPGQVIGYLGQYTNKVAIGNQRIEKLDEQLGEVYFKYKDYADGGRIKQMKLKEAEFVRRFEQHILPCYFTRIRSYGYLANRGRSSRMVEIVAAMGLPAHPPAVKVPWQVRILEMTGRPHDQCPACNRRSMVLISICCRPTCHDG